jgi:hypothetical protein
MKKTLHILLATTVFAICPLRANDADSVSAKIGERLREIDVAAALKLYERVQSESNAVRFKLYMLEVRDEVDNSETRDKQIKTLTTQLAKLKARAEELRTSIPKIGLGAGAE